MIIDAHTHLGYDHVFEHDFTPDELLMNMKTNKIDTSMVQPGITLDLKTVIKQHNTIASLSEENLGKIYGIANPSPHLPTTEYRKELERCVNEMGFVGVKLHPLGHAIDPNKSKGRKVFQIGSDLNIPIMVHTGTGIPWSLPSALIKPARDYPELKIIIAHSGGLLFAHEAALAAQLCPNIYLESSFLPGFLISRFCKDIGAERIMFGSDHGDNVTTELTKFRTLGLSDVELEWCLGKTAAKLFNIPKD